MKSVLHLSTCDLKLSLTLLPPVAAICCENVQKISTRLEGTHVDWFCGNCCRHPTTVDNRHLALIWQPLPTVDIRPSLSTLMRQVGILHQQNFGANFVPEKASRSSSRHGLLKGGYEVHHPKLNLMTRAGAPGTGRRQRVGPSTP